MLEVHGMTISSSRLHAGELWQDMPACANISIQNPIECAELDRIQKEYVSIQVDTIG